MRIEFAGGKNQTSDTLKRAVASRVGALLAILLAVSVLGFTAGCVGLVSGETPANKKQLKQQLSLQFAPASLNFGSVPTGKSTSVTTSVTNTGATAEVITQIVSSSNQFTTSGLTFPLTLGPGQTATFIVSFSGSVPGKASGTLSFQAEGSTAQDQIPVTATAATPQAKLTASPAIVDAGSATVGSKTTSNITLSNTGNADLTISVITVTGAPFGVTGITTPTVISAGQSATMGVNFTPAAVGAASGTISVG